MKSEIRSIKSSEKPVHRKFLGDQNSEGMWRDRVAGSERVYRSMRYKLANNIASSRKDDVVLATQKLEGYPGIKRAAVNWSDADKEIYIEYLDMTEREQMKIEGFVIDILRPFM